MTLTAVVPTRTFAYSDRLLRSMECSEPGSAKHVVLVDTGMPGYLGGPGTSSPLVDSRGLSSVHEYFLIAYGATVIKDIGQSFVYARAINAGSRAAPRGSHLLLLNDDAVIESKYWHETLEEILRVDAVRGQALGLLSCAIMPGGVGNLQQEYAEMPHGADGPVGPPRHVIREITGTVCFVACAVPAHVWAGVTGGTHAHSIGLDERYTGYGMEDDDYTTRVRRTGYHCYVTDAVIVRHLGNGEIPMHGTFSRHPNLREMFLDNQRRYREKWEGR